MEYSDYDLIIVGAGPVGAVVAERSARLYGYKSLIIEKRDHIAGNCYDSFTEQGVQIHNYGPHYFRTNNNEVVEYLSQFTDWIEGNYIVKSQVKGELYPFPINLETLEKFFNLSDLDKDSAEALLEEKRIYYADPQNSEEFVLNRVGKELYEAFYLSYTKKQWNKHPRDLDASVCGRIPIKLNRDPYYVEADFRKIPKEGYTKMFDRILDHPLIDVKLSQDYFEIKDKLVAKIATVYTGPIDKFYAYRYGKLEWRSLRFEFEHFEQNFKQECVQINYPNDYDYTRSVEIKHVSKQEHPHTVVCKEFPQDIGDPYYPVPNKENRERYIQYKELAEKEQKIIFVGRLAEYTYINTDEAIAKALKVAEKLINLS